MKKIVLIEGTVKQHANPRFAGSGTAQFVFLHEDGRVGVSTLEVTAGGAHMPCGYIGNQPIFRSDYPNEICGYCYTTGDDGFRSFYKYVLNEDYYAVEDWKRYDRETPETKVLFGSPG